jgi:tRNA threonylcarbamoyladenosine biosynthesis protein TsaB
MIVLGIETATPVCSVGLADGGRIASECRILTPNAHAERLPALVRAVLDASGVEPAELGGIAVSIGPGSFTGLRIGLGFAKGMSAALGIPLAAVPTSDALAAQAPPARSRACVLIASGKREAFLATYRRESERWIREGDIRTVDAAGLAKEAAAGDAVFLGDGIGLFGGAARPASDGALFLDAVKASGLFIAVEGLSRFASGAAADADSLVPEYLKAFQGVI